MWNVGVAGSEKKREQGEMKQGEWNVWRMEEEKKEEGEEDGSGGVRKGDAKGEEEEGGREGSEKRRTNDPT